MSSSKVISEVSQLLKKILKDGMPTVSVDVQSPVDLDDAPNGVDLTLWLYQVTPNAYLRNAPNVRVRGEEFEEITPLSLDLYYLLTPVVANEIDNQTILGRALQILYDNSVLPLRAVNDDGINPPTEDVEELHINICQRSIEELAKVWEATQKPYRLSVCFEVRVVRIDSERRPPAGRVRDRVSEFQDKPEEVAV
jgi:hypothetical protein